MDKRKRRILVIFLVVLAISIPLISIITFVLADNPPYYVRLTYASAEHNDTEMHVTYNTNGAPSTNVVWDTVSHASPGDYPNSAIGVEQYWSNIGKYVHEVNMTDLEANTRYYYRVGCDGVDGGWSAEYSFRSGYEEIFDNFNFVAYGDTRTNDNDREAVLDAISWEIDNNDVRFVLNTGDLVDEEDSVSEWNDHFSDIQECATKAPYMSLTGNHDDGGGFYGVQHYNPHNGYLAGESGYQDTDFSYWYIYANCFFVMLDYDFEYENTAHAHYDWLKGVLQYANDLRDMGMIHWLIVSWHCPPFNSGVGHGEDEGIQDNLCPVLEQYGVDVVFNGHEHIWEREGMIWNGGDDYNKNDVITTDIDNDFPGPVYIVAGGGGAPRTPIFCVLISKPYSVTHKCANSYGLVSVTLDLNTEMRTTLRIRGRDDNHDTFDSGVTLVKTGLSPPSYPPPEITMDHPQEDEVYETENVEVNWTIDATECEGLDRLWIDTDTMIQQEISPSLTEYDLLGLDDGTHWVKLRALGNNGMYATVNHTFHVSTGDPIVWITSSEPDPTNTTQYIVKWDSVEVESVAIKLNNIEIVNGLAASNPDVGYTVTGLTQDFDNSIKVIGSKTGHDNHTDTITIHPYCQSPDIYVENPNDDEIFLSGNVKVDFNVFYDDSGGISRMWMETNKIEKTQIYAFSFTIDSFDHGGNWFNITVEGSNGMYNTTRVNFEYELYKPTVSITSDDFGDDYLDHLNYTLSWSGTYCEECHIWLNDEYYAGPYGSEENDIDITGLVENSDNTIEVVGTSEYGTNRSDTLIFHPYCGCPRVMVVLPVNSTVIKKHQVEFCWSCTHEIYAGGLLHFVIETSTGRSITIEEDIEEYVIKGFPKGEHWIKITAYGKNGHYSVSYAKFTVDPISPLVIIGIIVACIGAVAFSYFAYRYMEDKRAKDLQTEIEEEWGYI
ncbi:MAG: hypothetical protein GF364_00950, partial [Candidatus Lokiarchaeota archaeon]|nr:hypothetical protein [Candidatus Lokiarchaeota archaeon]